MSRNSANSIPEGATELADSKIFIETMMSEMRRVMRLEFEQVHERIDLMENKRVEQPRNAPNARRRERVQPREVRVEDEENYGAGFDEDDQDSVVSNRRYGGRFREDRNREDNNLGSITMKFPSSMRMSFPMKHHMGYLQSEGLNIKLILFLVDLWLSTLMIYSFTTET
ncbi:hypothetical protein CRG98_000144 [Punica granatum]|uniref:Uncharacterized protein n=1 Tax=Punica granatum TaxID=22663 RepID=A0A2I0LFL7_PUNGR|nr:hypothetical protein CRG98_000144 [Punica granatum]